MKRHKWHVFSAVIGALLWVVPMTATVKSGKTVRSAWPPETVSGTIMSVDASKDLVIVKGPDNVPYDIKVGRGTRILSGTQPLRLASLAQEVNQRVSVRFTPERSGDMARLIQIQR
jgi:hypothetical protein